MKVSALKKQLEMYKDDEELFVAYWDKEWVEDLVADQPLTDDEWSEVVNTLDEGEFYWQSLASETINKTVELIVNERGK